MSKKYLPKARIPVATYRIQFNGQFRFRDATELVPYLAALGISDVYASPLFKARKGSLHGYDIVDHDVLNPEVGTREEFDGLAEELRRHGMGLLLDIVPNHMCIGSSENAWWMDVLENGPSSPYSDVFDIDWNPVKQAMHNKVLLPILGDQYGAVLENGELALTFDEGAFFLKYYDHTLPIMPKSYSAVLTHRLDELEQALSAGDVRFQELLSIDTALKNLPACTEEAPERIVERYREKEIVKRRICTLYNGSPEIRGFIDGNIAIFNGERGAPASFDLLDDLLRRQVYRLSHWRVATEEINYRRFFDINDLGAIRVEKVKVFSAVFRLVLALIRERKVTGLRVDHADGLFNPSEFLRRLQGVCFAHSRMGSPAGGQPDDERIQARERRYLRHLDKISVHDPSYRPFYIVCEKILMHGEQIPDDWPVFGETGYSFANALNAIFVATDNAKAFDKIYRRFIRTAISFQDIIHENKKLVMQAAMSSEINTLGHYLDMLAGINRHTLDFTRQSLIKALVEVIAFFPVYRTYTFAFEVAERDRRYIEYAVALAKRKNPAMSASIFDFIKDVLLLDLYGNVEGDNRCRWLDFTMRIQQITGPVMAKGVEDTAFYQFSRLVSLNEVGGSPERFGLPLAVFHEQNRERRATRPHSMLATSTHDTKRSEDVRARINVLSEMPLPWREAIKRWNRLNRRHKRFVEGQLAPGRNEEYLLYQTLIGAWPCHGPEETEFDRFRQRIGEYMTKALREAKVNTSWINPNSVYEEAVTSFIDAILKKTKTNHFLGEMEKFQAMISACGQFNSLSQTLIKITSPGVPDFYQGSELWDFSLVDPDNRRPVDFQGRRKALDEMMRMESVMRLEQLAGEFLETRGDGRIKMYLIRTALGLRNRERELFDMGAYLPLTAEGDKEDNVCAFARTMGDSAVIVVAPRFFTRLIREPDAVPCGATAWGNTRLLLPGDPPGSRYRNVFTGEILTGRLHDGRTFLPLAEILVFFPVALMERMTNNIPVI